MLGTSPRCCRRRAHEATTPSICCSRDLSERACSSSSTPRKRRTPPIVRHSTSRIESVRNGCRPMSCQPCPPPVRPCGSQISRDRPVSTRSAGAGSIRTRRTSPRGRCRHRSPLVTLRAALGCMIRATPHPTTAASTCRTSATPLPQGSSGVTSGTTGA